MAWPAAEGTSLAMRGLRAMPNDSRRGMSVFWSRMRMSRLGTS